MATDNIFDSVDNHKLGFLIALNTDSNQIEVQKIDNPEDFAAEMEYDFEIPQLSSDEVAKELAKANGYLFTDKVYPYKITGKLKL